LRRYVFVLDARIAGLPDGASQGCPPNRREAEGEINHDLLGSDTSLV
jgi:hypothetical protein